MIKLYKSILIVSMLFALNGCGEKSKLEILEDKYESNLESLEYYDIITNYEPSNDLEDEITIKEYTQLLKFTNGLNNILKKENTETAYISLPFQYKNNKGNRNSKALISVDDADVLLEKIEKMKKENNSIIGYEYMIIYLETLQESYYETNYQLTKNAKDVKEAFFGRKINDIN